MAPLNPLLAAAASESSGDWASWFSIFDKEQRLVVVVVAIGCLTGVIVALATIVSAMVAQASKRKIEAELKRELIDHGMSADDIVRVVEATAPDEKTSQLKALGRCR